MSDYDDELIMLDRRAGPGSPVASSAARREYLDRQDRVEHEYFDVFEDHFPTDADSYLITSAGFMTSNLRPSLSYSQEIKSARLGTIATSVHAIARVIDLVALGKRVDCLFVLVEQRQLIARNHRVPHAPRVPFVARNCRDRAKRKEADRVPVLEHRIRRVTP